MAVFLATYRDGFSGGVIRLAVVDKDGTCRELLRPDNPESFPTFVEPKTHTALSPHISQ